MVYKVSDRTGSSKRKALKRRVSMWFLKETKKPAMARSVPDEPEGPAGAEGILWHKGIRKRILKGQ